MKKLVALILMGVICLSFASCGRDQDDVLVTEPASSEIQEESTTQESESSSVETTNVTTANTTAATTTTAPATQVPTTKVTATNAPATKAPTTNAPATKAPTTVADTTKADKLPVADLDALDNSADIAKDASEYAEESYEYLKLYINYNDESDKIEFYNKLQKSRNELVKLRNYNAKYSNLQSTLADIDAAIANIDKILTRSYSLLDEVNMFGDAIESITAVFTKLNDITKAMM